MMKTVLIVAAVLAAGGVGYWLYQRFKPTATQAKQGDTAIAKYGG